VFVVLAADTRQHILIVANARRLRRELAARLRRAGHVAFVAGSKDEALGFLGVVSGAGWPYPRVSVVLAVDDLPAGDAVELLRHSHASGVRRILLGSSGAAAGPAFSVLRPPFTGARLDAVVRAHRGSRMS
jgi:hypothetical protein